MHSFDLCLGNQIRDTGLRVRRDLRYREPIFCCIV
jgi:hypothetical protein